MISMGFIAEAFLLYRLRQENGCVKASIVVDEADFLHGITAASIKAAARRFTRPVRDGSAIYWVKKEGAEYTWSMEAARRRELVRIALGDDAPWCDFINVFKCDEERDSPRPVDSGATPPPWCGDNVVPLDKKDTLE